MGRSPCCSKEGLNRGAWTALEDKTLSTYIKARGEGKWRDLPKRAGLKRCGKSCRLRWLNYLRPDIKRGNISDDEEELIIRLHKLLGNRWSLIAGRLPGRTDNEIKNYWNTNLGKRFNHQKSPPQPQQQTTCHPSKDNPAITPIDEPKTSAKPVIIRTKAIRCNKVVVSTLPPSPPSLQQPDDNNITNPSPDDQDPAVPILMDQDFLTNYLQSKDQGQNFDFDFEFDFLNYDKCNEYFQGGGGDGEAVLQGDHYHNNNFSFLGNDESFDGGDQVKFKDSDVDGIGTGFENGANLDMESLAVLLDTPSGFLNDVLA